jgi:hypothetical protein
MPAAPSPRRAAIRLRRIRIDAGHATAALRWLLPLAASAALACQPERAGPVVPALAPIAADALRVTLVFGADVDLDLYVTGPSQETVYYGNASAREGGALDADRRCGAPGPDRRAEAAAPRAESIVFPAAAPGRYRVGVDFPQRCEAGVDRARFLVRVEAPGRPPVEQRGRVDFGAFVSRVLELRVGDEP